jgi:Flp pilus assembly protein TadG
MFKIPSILKDFRKNDRGNLAIVFAGAIIPVGILIGTSYDFGRAFNTREAMQQTLDAAVFAAGREFDRTANMQEAREAGIRHFDAALPKDIKATVSSFEGDAQGNITMRAFADVQTTFLKIAGTETLDVEVDASSLTEDEGGMHLELAIVFDVTGSMGENRGAKLAAAQDAANELINILMPTTEPGNRSVRISIVPFSSMVNLGEYAAAATNAITHKFRTCKTPKSWPNQDQCKTYNSWQNGTPTSAQAAAVPPPQYQVLKGCTVERMDGANGGSDDNAYGDAPPGAGAWFRAYTSSNPSNPSCTPLHPIVPLTDATGRDSVLLPAINSFTANGSTAGHIGTMWGYYTISERWANFWAEGSKPAVRDPRLLKAIIIMTDGIYNLHYKSNGGSVSEFSQNTLNPAEGNGTSRDQALRTCQHMKDNGIEVFAVGVELPTDDEDGVMEEDDYARTTLEQCVSSPNHLFERHFYNVLDALNVGDGLSAAFTDIGNKIATATGTGNSRLRLTR